jgi:hypothetical protein
MSELGFNDYIVLNYSMILSLAFALIGAGALSATDIASQCRTSAENMPDGGARTRLLAFAQTLEEAEACADRLLAPGWTPEVVAGGKDEGEGAG